MSTEVSERGNTYVANINVSIASRHRFRIELEDASPDSFLIETGASGDGRFAINADPGQPCPYEAIEFVFTVGEGYAFDSRGFMDCAKVKNSGWRFGPAKISGSQCSVTAEIPAGAGMFDDYVLFCQPVNSPAPTLLEVGPRARRGGRGSERGGRPAFSNAEESGHTHHHNTGGLDDFEEESGHTHHHNTGGLDDFEEESGHTHHHNTGGLDDFVEESGHAHHHNTGGVDD